MLRISAKVDYGVRALVEIARAEGRPVKSHELAHQQGIPVRFLGTTLTELRRAGLVESRRGADGGYWLSRSASAITVADVIRTIDGGLVDIRATPDATTSTRLVWAEIGRRLTDLLGTVTIADLVAGRSPAPIP